MRALPSPSAILGSMLAPLIEHIGQDEVTLKGETFDTMVAALMKIREMTIHLEHEVGALRLAEVARRGRRMIDKLATDQLIEMIGDPDGKILRPDFGGQK